MLFFNPLHKFSGDDDDEEHQLAKEQWTAFCSFHLGDYQKALQEYKSIRDAEPATEDITLNIAVCMFYLGMYEEAHRLMEQTPNTSQKLRLLFHLAHKFGNEAQVTQLQDSLQEDVEDQLSLASMHYLRAHYQDAIDIYKRLLLDNKCVEWHLGGVEKERIFH